jgi:chromosome segregation ATPase
VREQAVELKEAKSSVQSLKGPEASLLTQLKSSEQSRRVREDQAADKDALIAQLNGELSNAKSVHSSLQIANEDVAEQVSTAAAQLNAFSLP